MRVFLKIPVTLSEGGTGYLYTWRGSIKGFTHKEGEPSVTLLVGETSFNCPLEPEAFFRLMDDADKENVSEQLASAFHHLHLAAPRLRKAAPSFQDAVAEVLSDDPLLCPPCEGTGVTQIDRPAEEGGPIDINCESCQGTGFAEANPDFKSGG